MCNAAHVPGSCLIAFGFVKIWLLLGEKRKLPTDGSLLLHFHFSSPCLLMFVFRLLQYQLGLTGGHGFLCSDWCLKAFPTCSELQLSFPGVVK